MSMLQREPEFRPSAAELWYERLPKVRKKPAVMTVKANDTVSLQQIFIFKWQNPFVNVFFGVLCVL